MIGECFGKVHSFTWGGHVKGATATQEIFGGVEQEIQIRKVYAAIILNIDERRYWTFFLIYILCMIGALLLSGHAAADDFDLDPLKSSTSSSQ